MHSHSIICENARTISHTGPNPGSPTSAIKSARRPTRIPVRVAVSRPLRLHEQPPPSHRSLSEEEGHAQTLNSLDNEEEPTQSVNPNIAP